MRHVLLIALVGCATPGTYPCTTDEQCARAGEQGFCQALGYCSFVDFDCSSGQRFDATADPELANDCVDYDDIGCVDQLALGATHTCLRLQNGDVRCWGDNSFGQYGNNSKTPATLTGVAGTADAVDASDLSAGAGFTCAIQDDLALCWGDNTGGKLGNGTTNEALMAATVMPLPPNSELTDISAGDVHGCLATSNGLRCWGNNDNAQFGNASTTGSLTAAVAGNDKAYTRVAAGAVHTCGLLSGDVDCWGSNDDGQIGNGEGPGLQQVPALIAVMGNVQQLAVGARHSCVKTSGGDVFCWGKNDRGQVGIGNLTSPQTEPQQVLPLANILSLTAGADFACALDVFGSVWCWGDNTFGQLGTTGDSRGTPAQVAGLTSAIAVAAGHHHACARRRDDSIVCWGRNDDGQVTLAAAGGVVREPVEAGFLCP